MKSWFGEKSKFEFGANWQTFLKSLDEDQIHVAETSIQERLQIETLEGSSFLDAGSGSGLFSLAARNLGASVRSFDFDPQSVACTLELREQYFPNDSNWVVEHGSVLDIEYLQKMEAFDIVYSWGVLHHTGNMWSAIENVISLVKPKGVLFIAIYNDQGWKSQLWWIVKYTYNILPNFMKLPFAYAVGLSAYLLNIIKYTLKLKPGIAISAMWNYKANRGMNLWVDMVDWIGGFPFEVASFQELQKVVEQRGFELVCSKEATSLGCHEMVFRKI